MNPAINGSNSVAIEHNCLTLPAWFPADKAAAVLRQQRKQFVLLADHKGTTHAASLDQLEQAPATKSVLWCGRPLGPAVSTATPRHEALRLMETHVHSYLPILMGGVVLGILTRQALAANGPSAGTSSATRSDEEQSLAA